MGLWGDSRKLCDEELSIFRDLEKFAVHKRDGRHLCLISVSNGTGFHKYDFIIVGVRARPSRSFKILNKSVYPINLVFFFPTAASHKGESEWPFRLASRYLCNKNATLLRTNFSPAGWQPPPAPPEPLTRRGFS